MIIIGIICLNIFMCQSIRERKRNNFLLIFLIILGDYFIVFVKVEIGGWVGGKVGGLQGVLEWGGIMGLVLFQMWDIFVLVIFWILNYCVMLNLLLLLWNISVKRIIILFKFLILQMSIWRFKVVQLNQSLIILNFQNFLLFILYFFVGLCFLLFLVLIF